MRRKMGTAFIVAILMLCLVVNSKLSEAAPTINGSGTAEDPYQISTEEQLRSIPEYGLGKCYQLMNDITLNGEWIPIGKPGSAFTGTFNGNSCAINNLTINNFIAYQGLFGAVNTATIMNVGMKNAVINASTNSGGIVGYAVRATIENCYVEIDLQGEATNHGGIVGLSLHATKISNCFVEGSIKGKKGVGGILGGIDLGTNSKMYITNCYSTADIYGNTDIGGITGTGENKTISFCYASGKINGSDYVAGISADTTASNIAVQNCVSLSEEIVERSGNKRVGRIWQKANKPSNNFNNYAYEHTVVKNKSARNFVNESIPLHTSKHGANVSNEDLKKASTYQNIGWDFDNIWKIDANISEYPILRAIPDSVQTYGKRYGTKDNPYLIYTENDLDKISETGLDVYYKLMSNIKLNENRNPIGEAALPFTGSFDGNNHVIYNVNIDWFAADAGLFGVTRKAEIKNLNLREGHVYGYTNTGGLIGRAIASIISRCSSNLNIEGEYNHHGGLIGALDGGTIKECFTTGNVIGQARTGGLVGTTGSGGSTPPVEVSNCYSTANVYGSKDLGGIAGGLSTANVFNCYATGKIDSGDYVAGIAGDTTASDIRVHNCVSISQEVISRYNANRVGRVWQKSNQPSNNYSNLAYEDMIVKSGSNVIDVKDTNPLASSRHGENKSMAALQQQSTYEQIGWDFDSVWEMDTYPKLRFEAFVKQVPVTGVEIQELIELKPGEDIKIQANVIPSDADNQNVSWHIKDEEVATIDELGNIHAIKVGITEITVTTVDGQFEDKAILAVYENSDNQSPNGTVFVDGDTEVNKDCINDSDLNTSWHATKYAGYSFGVELDKAVVLNTIKIKNSGVGWIGVEYWDGTKWTTFQYDSHKYPSGSLEYYATKNPIVTTKIRVNIVMGNPSMVSIQELELYYAPQQGQ